MYLFISVYCLCVVCLGVSFTHWSVGVRLVRRIHTHIYIYMYVTVYPPISVHTKERLLTTDW